jgi:AcrR family transcriptional regulator
VPRHPNPDLESKILDAAQKLWKKGGEKSLTMRSVARAAGTNTPAVYRRFRDRDDILRGVLHRIRLDLAAALEAASSPEEGGERCLDYALNHPHEYELFFRHNYELNHSPRSGRGKVKLAGQPARDAMRRKLAEKLGGSPQDHERLLTALWMLLHGAAMLLISKTILPKDAAKARAVFTAAVGQLLQAAERA